MTVLTETKLTTFPSHLLRDRVAIVTGGSRGIGRATVQRLAEAGAHVVVNYLTHTKEATDAVREVTEQGVRSLAIQADVSKSSEAAALIEKTLDQFGRLDLLVANAGIWEGAPVDEMSDDIWDRVLDCNLRGTWTVSRAAVPALKKQRRRLDRNRQLDGGTTRRSGLFELRGFEGWPDQLRQVARSRAGAKHSRKRRGARDGSTPTERRRVQRRRKQPGEAEGH